jgi:predicted nucleic acid-binding Zn ribbon protein
MALFKRKQGGDAAPGGGGAGAPGEGQTQPLMAQTAWCRKCNADREFSQVWLRVRPAASCSCCGAAFDDVDALLHKNLPACPRCGEHLEHPGFQYGLCDGCGSKYELLQGAKPTLLPNAEQRKAMDQFGKSWSYD